MLFLKEVTDSKQCEADIDYCVPFTISLKAEKSHGAEICWRTGNFKNSLLEIAFDKRTGILKEITLLIIAYLLTNILINSC